MNHGENFACGMWNAAGINVLISALRINIYAGVGIYVRDFNNASFELTRLFTNVTRA